MLEYEVRLTPVYMENSGEFLGRARLRKFQKELADIKDGLVALSAPTGSGKTVTLLTDSENRVAVGMYPNNELLRSQVAGLHNFITSYMGMQPRTSTLLNYCLAGDVPGDYVPLNIYESEKPVDALGARVSRVYVVGLSGDVVKAVAGKGKLDVIVDVSDRMSKLNENEYAVAVATPDTFFLLLAYAYGNLDAVGRFLHYVLMSELPSTYEEFDRFARAVGIARSRLEKIVRAILPYRRSTLFIDEYHLYGFYELSSFKALLYALTSVHGWSGRLVLSSATPSFEFRDEIARELSTSPKTIDGLKHVKEQGDESELVRGSVRLVFTEVKAEGANATARLYGASEHAYELVSSKWFREFIEAYREGRGRGMVILEKVSHAELFAEVLHREVGVKPLCLYSMPREDVCEVGVVYGQSGGLIVVGTGAKIGQGVEFQGISFGVVARVTAHDFLQSLSRIGRRLSGESTVLVPLGKQELEKLKEVDVFKKRAGVTYVELAEWADNTAKPFMERVPRGCEKLYSSLISTRESLLKLSVLVLHYRLSSARYDDLKKMTEQHRSQASSLTIVAPPDHIGTLLMFRSTGPSVTYCRELSGEIKCYDKGEDLGTIIRNYEVESVDGRLILRGVGRGEVEVICDSIHELEGFAKSQGYKGGKGQGSGEEKESKFQGLTLTSWGVLRELFKCYLVAGERGGEESRLHRLERELEDQLLLVPNITSDELAEYIYRMGRGLRVKMQKGSIILLYL